MTFNFNLASLNIKGLGKKKKRHEVFHWLKKYHNGIILLQETHCTTKYHETWRREWDGEIYFSDGSSNSRGVAILLPKRLDYKVKDHTTDTIGRWQTLIIEIDQQEFFIINNYAPVKSKGEEQLAFLKEIEKELYKNLDKNIIWAGDYNTVLNPKMDKEGGNLDNQITCYTNRLIEVLDNFHLIDLWRFKYPGWKKFTWACPTPLIQCRLDYLIVSEFLTENTHIVEIITCPYSDHNLVKGTFQGNLYRSRGPGFWKFNASLLEDSEFNAKIKDIFGENKAEYTESEDKGLIWDTIKTKIRGFCLQYSFAKNKAKNRKEKELAKIIRLLETKPLLSEEELQRKAEAEEELKQINEKAARGIAIRAHAAWCEEGEHSTQYFLNLEKRNYKRKCITKLKRGDISVTEPEEILREQYNFYNTLYKKDPMVDVFSENCNDFFERSQEVNIISDHQNIISDAPITMEELTEAVKSIKNNKSPGSDGFTGEFYKRFWEDIKWLLLDQFKYAIKHGKLSIDQRRGVITTVPKGNKDRTKLENWRPITLLNVDYKIFAKVLASRLCTFLPDIIHPNQTGFVKGRYIGENIRLIDDLLVISAYRNLEGFLVALDFEKAYDKIDWSFIDRALGWFGIGVQYRNMVRCLYNGAMSCVINNGYASEFFVVSRGVRQGCPISPFLFVIAAEIMAINIRRNINIPGICIGDIELKISLFADDTTCFIGTKEGLTALFELLHRFQLCSGLKINKNKTEILKLFEPLINRPDNIPSKWIDSEFKILGIKFSTNHEQLSTLNFANRIQELKTVIKVWSWRNLSYQGKNLLMKSLGISKFVYAGQNIEIDQNVINETQKIIWNFIWDNKPVKVKREVMQQEIKNGGLNIINLEWMIDALKINWINRLQEENSLTRKILDTILGTVSFLDLCRSRGEITDDIIEKLPAFYVDILKSLKKIMKYSIPESAEEIQYEMLWFNTYIKVNGKPLFYKSWYKKG